MKLNLDLAEKGPEGLISTAEIKDKKYYPSLHITTDEKVDFPKEGTAVIKFKKISSSEREREGEKPRYECTLEVQELISIESEKDDKPTNSHDEAGDALDKLAAEKSKSKKKNNPGDENERY